MNKKNKKTAIWIVVFSFCMFCQTAWAQTESITRGQNIYGNECVTCHQEDGSGIMGAFPPLVDSDYFKEDISKAVNAILGGLSGELEVNGMTYYGEMEPVNLTDQEVADVLNYVQNSLNNIDANLTVDDIKKMKD